ncbi:MFS transporter [Nocardia aurantia]|uniref:Multidrug resistance protein 3 n=1 Tax=Nocardia aurantia TaxID=2585199 RepID=A0A7K0DJP5_9NOCA|nr:MFS transporter [Nocardia aurantia]MQY25878.1 Multidrug resistance protein 3 [Nocardia aurantia]
MDDRDVAHEEQTGGGGLLVLAVAAVAYSLAQTAVVPGLSQLTKALHTSSENVSWVLTGYLVSAAILTPVGGRLGDMFGKRRVLAIALAAFTVGSVVAALSGSIWVLVAARVVQGAGGAVFPLCFGIISDAFPAERRPGALGLISAIAGIGAGGGLLMGGLLLDHASWRWIFWAGAIMAGLAALGTLRLPQSTTHTPGRVDLVGALLLAVGLTAPLIALTRTTKWGWGDARTLGLIVGGLLVLALFAWFETRIAEPLVNVRLLARPVVLGTNVATALIGFGMFGAFVLIPQIAETPVASGYGFGMNATGAGLLLLPACLVMLVTGGVSGQIGMRLGPRFPLVVGLLIAVAGLAVLAGAHHNRWLVLALCAVVFGGIGLGMAAVPNLIVGAVPPEATGEATGVNALVRSVGSSIGSQVAATVLAGSVTAASALPTDSALTEAFWLGAAGSACAAVAALLIPRDRRGADAGAELLDAAAPVSDPDGVRAS